MIGHYLSNNNETCYINFSPTFCELNGASASRSGSGTSATASGRAVIGAAEMWWRRTGVVFFFEPVPPKWYQRLSLWYRVKQPVPKPSKFTQNIFFGWDLNSRPLASHIAPLPSQLHSCSDREGDIFLLK